MSHTTQEATTQEPIYRDRTTLSPRLKDLLGEDEYIYRDAGKEAKHLTIEERLDEIRKECSHVLQLDNTYYVLNNLLSTVPLLHGYGDYEDTLLTDEQRLQLIRDEIKILCDIGKLGR